ncbi:TRITHORAX-RELATED PROTEIN 6 [Perilla frutescens var. hirtella]|nr:TRITHORAX-RELATED PROTEIN 6 [Perilla frutescens var. frutescens]KAH6784089.1 TRITHORAX-RELATED PROTEIN 6 [Perilla frutescens var. hirtella]
MASLRKRTQAPKPGNSKIVSRKRSRSKQEGADDYSDTRCEKCGSGQYPSELLLCDKCDCGFHLFCLRPVLVAVPKGRWFCPSCSNLQNPTNLSLVQTKIVDFFRIQRSSQPPEKLTPESRKKRRRTGGLVMSKRRRKLLPFIPTEDPVRRLEQMASLATALNATGTEFSNELVYIPSMAPRSANCAALERDGMQVMSKDDSETLSLCKNMMERGEWPPLMVVFDPREGFTVEADRCIRDLTIITEYIGDVDFLKNREHDDGDSMMTLLTATDPSKSLVICPDKRSNIARFVNGINNHIPGGKKKQNVKCLRFDVNGECRVLLIASRDIRKGERLYYDYNGYENEYPTEHFV